MLKKISPLLLLLILITMTASITLAQEPDESLINEGLNFEDYEVELVDYTLPNGLRVILAEDHSAPVVAMDIWYYVGGANDPQDRSGFAHMFEHMLFRGSDNVEDGEFDTLLEAVGARNNAYTTADNTAYWEVAPVNQLPLLLWLESDRMASFNVQEEAFIPEREVVGEEYNLRVANRAYGQSGQRLFTQPFQGYVPYERAVIGNMDNLAAASLDELQDFHNIYYKPNNAVLTIVGDIDIEQTQTLIQAYFGDIPSGDDIPPSIIQQYPLPAEFPTLRIDTDTACLIGYEETYIDSQVQLPRFTATVVGPPRGNPDYYALKLLTAILDGGNSSRFEQNIVSKGLAASVFMGLRDYKGASVLFMGAFPNTGDSLETVQTLLRSQYDDIIENGITDEELERVKKQTLVGAITAFRESVLDTAEWLQDATFTFGHPTAIADELAMYETVTAADIQRVAQTYLCQRPMNSLITLPEGEKILADYPGPLVEPIKVKKVKIEANNPKVLEIELTAELLAKLPAGIISRTEPPASLPVVETNFPPFETFKLDNGLEVIFVEQHELPKLRAELFVGGSNAATSADKQGVADFMVELLTKGTQTRTADEIATAIESVGGQIGFDAAIEWTSLSVESLQEDSHLALDLLADMAQNPTFPQEEFEVIIEQTKTFLEQYEVNPNTLANRQFARLAYGGHPYGYDISPESVENMTPDDILDFYQTYYKPNNALLVMVGDMSSEGARTLAEDAFAAWEAADVPDFLDYPPAKIDDTSLIYLIDRPDSEQATLQIGNQGINARNPDRYALIVLNAVLGSGSTSRLYSNLRDDKGYTYGIHSRFSRPNDTSTFRILSDVNQEHAAEAITEILKELQIIRTQKIPAQELADNKGLIIGSFALAIEDPADFSNHLSIRHLTGIPLEELNTHLQKIDQVTANQARKAAAKYINAKDPIIVIVGDAKILKPQLEKIGQVIIVDGEGNEVTNSE